MQASVSGLCEQLCVEEPEALQLIRLSVTLAKEATKEITDNDRALPLVAGSVGPYGACQHDGSEYHGNYVDHMTSKELVEWHRPRVRELLAAGADILACETIPAKVLFSTVSAHSILVPFLSVNLVIFLFVQAEAEALVTLLGDFPEAKAWVTFSCKVW